MGSAAIHDPAHKERYAAIDKNGHLRARLVSAEDNFGKVIADGTTNDADIAAHHPFTPERLRLYKNGTRQFPHYNTVSEFTDAVDSYNVTPAGGETWTIKTAEQFSYRVGYVIVPSFAFEVSQSLSGDDIVAVSYGTADLANVTGTDLTTGSADGWILYQTGAMADNEMEFAIFRNGAEKRTTTVTFSKPITQLRRLALPLDWYNVGTSKLEETYVGSGPVDDIQENDILTEIGVDADRGPQTGNKNIEWSIKTDATTTGLTLKVGSSSVITLGGNVTPINRGKPEPVVQTISAADTWEPLYAIRKSPDYDTVSVQLRAVEILRYGASERVNLLALAMDPSKVDVGDGDFGANAPYHHSYNSAIESTSAITQIPDNTGTQVTPGTSTIPGGHVAGHAIITPDKGNSIRGETENLSTKRFINNNDVIVFCAHIPAGATTDTLVFRYNTKQNF